jgi:hypothetical protein
LDCSSQLAAAGDAGSTWTRIGDAREPGASVRLAAGDVMTCRFVNRVVPPTSGLVLRKITWNGTGSFGFDISGPTPTEVTATTTEPDVATVALPHAATEALINGTYWIQERRPRSTGAGSWALESAWCLSSTQTLQDDGITLPLPSASTEGETCTFVNRFTHGGSITIDKITRGGVASTRFQIDPEFDPLTEHEQVATTTTLGVAERARGDDTAAIPVGHYVIRETIAGNQGTRGDWRVNVVTRNGEPVPSIEGHIRITLTAEQPHQHCVFVNELLRNDPPDPPDPPAPPAEPVPPPAPMPDAPPGGVLGETVRPAELRITKRVRPRRVQVGQNVRYRVVVRNRGPAAAEQVTVGERTRATRRNLRLRTSKGRCRNGVPRYCVIGRLTSGKRAVLKVRLRTTRPGRFLNTVAVNTATPQRTLRNKRARARLTVAARPRFTG